MFRTQILDPTTHAPKLRTTFMLPPMDCVANLRLGGLAAILAGNQIINTASGIGGCVDTITLRINGATVTELRNASRWIAYVNHVGQAEVGASVLENTQISNERFIPFTRDKAAGGAAVAQSTVVCSYSNLAGVDAAGAQESYLQLAAYMPFLASIGVLQCSKYQVELEILYQSSFQNLLPLEGAPANVVLTQPYLILDQLTTNLPMEPKSFEYTNILNDVLVVPAVGNGVTQDVSLQSRGFVGRLVQDIIFVKSTTAYNIADNNTGALDSSCAQSQEQMRVWVDSIPMTTIASNPQLLQSYAPPHRAPLITQRVTMSQYLSQADTNTLRLLGTRSYGLVPINRSINETLQIDYHRVGFNTNYVMGTRQINLTMFGRVTSQFKYDTKTQSVMVL